MPFRPKKLVGNLSTFKLGISRHHSIAVITIRIPLSGTHFANILAQIVYIDVPLQLGLDVMTKFKVVLDFDADTACSKCELWTLPLTRKQVHAFIEWTPTIFYTERQIWRMHRHFSHPQTEHLIALMRRADPDNVSPRLYTDFENIKTTCGVCQREADEPHRF